MGGKSGKGKGDKGEKGKGKKGKYDPATVSCKFFKSAGGCTNLRCPFLHDQIGSTDSASKPAAPSGGAGKSGEEDAASASLGPCKFFGSAKGCSSNGCPFSHDQPNSVPPCTFKQQTGNCDKGDACTFRHVPWASAAQARQHYASREKGAVELSQQAYKKLHRDNGEPITARLKKEHVEMELVVEREIQEETYGTTALKMMEKMGYKAGAGLGKEEQGNVKLAAPCVALEKASQALVLGQGTYCVDARATAAERAARMADARAQKRPRLEETSFVQHNLLSDDESSDGEAKHAKTKDKQLRF